MRHLNLTKYFLIPIVFILFSQKGLSQKYCMAFVTTTNQAAKPTNDSSNLSANAIINQVLSQYGCVRYKQAFKNSVRANAINEFIIYASGNGDSLKSKLLQTGMFDSITNFGIGETASGCTTPVIVNDPLILSWDNWAMNNIDANCAWTITKGDPRVIIGFSDTEFDDGHEDLIGKFEKVWHRDPSYSGTVDYHGTKVASVAIANTNNNIGITSIGHNLKGAGYSLDGVDLPRDGIIQAYSEGKRVVNASFELTGLTPPEVLEMTQHGMILVLAAGNYMKGYHSDIANIPGVIAVGGVDKYNKHSPTFTDHYTWIDLCAPSLDVLRAHSRFDPRGIPYYSYSTVRSSSTASPIVAGVIGLMLSINPCLSPSEIEGILQNSCDPIADEASYPGLLGAGRLNAYKAVQMAQVMSCMNIKGIEINTICRPGKVSGLSNPQFTVKMEGGLPPYKYKWEPIISTTGGISNTTVLDHDDIANPTIISSTAPHIAYYRLIVTDQFLPEKMAIKVIKVQLSDNMTPIVAMRDSYMDMLNEANDQRTTNVYDIDTWTSPDIWNRNTNDLGTTHQNPEYHISASMPNFVYTNIKNYGCVASTTGQKLKLYWSKGSTGEKWEDDWKTTNVKDKFGALTMPGGREITPISSGINIPALVPTASVILSQEWFPPKPQDFEGSPSSFDACVLARIEKAEAYPFGMTIPEELGKGVGENVRNNNTIVTRNMVLTNLNTTDIKVRLRDVIVGNGDNVAQVYNLRFEADRPIYPLMNGDFSTRGKVVLHLGSLYDRWISAGGKGEYTSRNAQAKTVTMQGNSLLEMDSIYFAASERFTIQIEFALDSSVTITDSSFQRMHLRQYLTSKPDSLYGAVGYELRISPATQNNQRKTLETAVTSSESFKVSPNPTSGIIMISYNGDKEYTSDIVVSDMVGKKVMTDKATFSQGTLKEINLSRLASGIYLINITNAQGKTEVFKIVKE